MSQRCGELFAVDNEVLLYDVTSTDFEGLAETNPQAQRGYSRDHRPDRFERRLACEKMIERAVEPILVDLLIAKLEQIAKRKLLKLASNCASWVGSSILKFESDQAAWSSL